MSDPVVAQTSPYRVDLEEGQKYAYCTCGLSDKQPYRGVLNAGGSAGGADFMSLMRRRRLARHARLLGRDSFSAFEQRLPWYSARCLGTPAACRREMPPVDGDLRWLVSHLAPSRGRESAMQLGGVS